ncbi:GGDEF domain-containing protein [Sulfurimonas crateris]|nr:GGDEF domain-containing protein [Sulfurimonas crateris]
MKNIDHDKTKENFKYFILITIMPIIGIIVIFSYAFLHLQKDLEFIIDEIRGLSTIKEVQNTVFNLQRARGLTCIQEPSTNLLQELELTKEKISKNLVSLREGISAHNKNDFLKSELLNFTDSINKSTLVFASFDYFSKLIEEFMSYSNRISYGCNLILDPKMDSYVMIENVVYLLPRLIEYNGQIRAIAASTKDGELTEYQKEYFAIQLNKIEEVLKKLEFNLDMLYKTDQNIDIKEHHLKMRKAQKAIIEFTKINLLGTGSVALEPDGIFDLITKNINLIIALYDANVIYLEKSLNNRLNETKEVSNYVILAGVLSILFIGYINGIFYCKNRKYIKNIQKLTITDSMSSLYNRRHFDKVFEDNLKIQSRTKQPLVFIILDIDFFKQYNDTYGHQAGDIVIKIVAKNLRASLKRAGDMAFRLGGEEFGILCIGMSHSEALSFANSIKERIENEKVKHEKNQVSDYLTISMGVIVIEPDTLHNVNEIYRCADKALYMAKENGRNQVVIYNDKNFI